MDGEEAAMRHRSLAGPVILIGLGILFLLNNLHPDFSFWTNFARFWPFLLIVFGVLNVERARSSDGDDGTGSSTKVLTVCALPASMPRTDKAPDGTARGLDVAVAQQVGRIHDGAEAE